MKNTTYALLGMSIALVAAVCYNPLNTPRTRVTDHSAQPTPEIYLPSPEPFVPAPPVPVPNWHYMSSSDPLTDATISMAGARSTNTLEFGFPYNGAQYGTLALRKNGKKLDVFATIERGQIQCSSYSGCPIQVRFDSDPPKTYKGNKPADHSSTVVFIPDEVRFIERLKKSSTVTIGFTAYKEGSVVLKFDTSGLVWE